MTSPCNEVQDCLGNNTYHLHLRVPVTFTLPNGWSSTSIHANDADLLSSDPGYGVSLMENIAPAAPTERAHVDPRAGTTARSIARWLASRPFLVSRPVTRTTLGGLPAWQVDVYLAPHHPPSVGRCVRETLRPCTPLFLMDLLDRRTAGISGNERIRWTFVDLAGGGTTAVAVWDFTNRLDMLTPAQPLVGSIRFIEFR